MAKSTKSRGREFWARTLAEYEEVGGSLTAFARSRGVSTTSLTRWREKLASESKAVRFVELSTGSEASRAAALTVRLAGGAALEFGVLPPVEYVAAVVSGIGFEC